MFTYVKLNNFLSLDNVTFDLRETKNKVKKMAVIYGENGSGKTTLIKSFYFLNKQMISIDLEKSELTLRKFLDEKAKEDLPSEILEYLKNDSVSRLFSTHRTIGTDDNTRLEYGFEVNGHEGRYVIEFGDTLQYEQLYYFTGKQAGIVFEISKDTMKNPKLSSLIFKTKSITSDIKERILKYWGKHSALAIIYDILRSFNNDYIKENISDYLKDFYRIISETSVVKKDNSPDDVALANSSKSMYLLNNMERGLIPSSKKSILESTEKVLNIFFTQAYSDIKKVYFDTREIKKTINYNLIFCKIINGKIRNIPASMESSGTRRILDIVKYMFGVFCGCTVIMDEFDDGIHDLLLRVIIDSMQEYITGQLILTTHNTSLLESLDPKSVYIINGKYDGTKDIICLSDYKIQGHDSVRLRYIKGLYGGTPLANYISYDDIIALLTKKEG